MDIDRRTIEKESEREIGPRFFVAASLLDLLQYANTFHLSLFPAQLTNPFYRQSFFLVGHAPQVPNWSMEEKEIRFLLWIDTRVTASCSAFRSQTNSALHFFLRFFSGSHVVMAAFLLVEITGLAVSSFSLSPTVAKQLHPFALWGQRAYLNCRRGEKLTQSVLAKGMRVRQQ